MDGVYTSNKQIKDLKEQMEAKLRSQEESILNLGKQELHYRQELQEKTAKLEESAT